MEAVAAVLRTAGHSLGNLLTPVLGYGQVLAAGVPPGNPNTDRFLAACRRVADFALVLRAVPPDDDALIDIALRDLITRLGELCRGPVLVTPGDAVVRAVPADLERILAPLLGRPGAGDAAAPPFTVTVAIDDHVVDDDEAANHVGLATGPYVRVTCDDDLPPLDDENRVGCFEPRWAGRPEAGFRLYDTYITTARLGGHLCVDALPAGTRVTLYLPT
jgi:hypothetical protein